MPNNRRILCAAPHYLHTHGTPKTPQELKNHNCLCFMLSDRPHNKWSFSRDSENVTVYVKGSVQCDDGEIVHRLARMGEGIAYKSQLDVAEDLRNGTLVQFCSEWLGESAPLYLACAHRSQLRPVVRLLREFLVERLSTIDRII
jgi:DNA-binding transcriptional LysR family regulator